MAVYRIRRRIEIDAGHRISTHGSKCRNLHGHRYGVEAECEASALHADGEQTDMAIDFGFLKDEMLRCIDVPCDHGLIAALADREMLALFAPDPAGFEDWLAGLESEIERQGWAFTTETRLGTRLYVVPFQPTAEALAKHWFERLAGPVAARSDGAARLAALRVWETPNCMAEYIPLPLGSERPG
jgi:6-pyruvoyltetrahydropterin/6-carboxytetrahydropterin synthase